MTPYATICLYADSTGTGNPSNSSALFLADYIGVVTNGAFPRLVCVTVVIRILFRFSSSSGTSSTSVLYHLDLRIMIEFHGILQRGWGYLGVIARSIFL